MWNLRFWKLWLSRVASPSGFTPSCLPKFARLHGCMYVPPPTSLNLVHQLKAQIAKFLIYVISFIPILFPPSYAPIFRSAFSPEDPPLPSLRLRFSQKGHYGDRIPVRGRDFAHPPRQALGPTQPPIQWVPGLSQGVKRTGHGVDHPPPSSAEVKERVGLYLNSTSGPSWPVIGRTLTYFYLPEISSPHNGNEINLSVLNSSIPVLNCVHRPLTS